MKWKHPSKVFIHNISHNYRYTLTHLIPIESNRKKSGKQKRRAQVAIKKNRREEEEKSLKYSYETEEEHVANTRQMLTRSNVEDHKLVLPIGYS